MIKYLRDGTGNVQNRTVAVGAVATVIAGPMSADDFTSLAFYVVNLSALQSLTLWWAATIDDAVLPDQDPQTSWLLGPAKSVGDLAQTGGRQYLWLLGSFDGAGDNCTVWIRGVK